MGLHIEKTGMTLLRNLKQGYRALSRMKWVTPYGLHLSVAGFLGVAGFVLAIKDGKFGSFCSLQLFSEGENHSEELCLVPGLQNLGNNCFLNVILQALASCADIRPFLQKGIEESESLPVEEQVERMPLIFALDALLEELSATGKGRVVLSPRKLMLAMSLYIHNFNLSSQQDAEEAFLHLLSSLREELLDCYLPNQGTLAEVCASNRRILTPETINDRSEHERWQEYFHGPFDGIIEQIENYHCSRCWHIAAVKYVSLAEADERKIETLQNCGGEDSCNCRSNFQLDTLPWSNTNSCTIKQLSVARCPKILCVHVQRASMNMFGESVKLQGHIAFPLVLDLFPFTTTAKGTKNSERRVPSGQVKLQAQKLSLHFDHLNLQFYSRIREHAEAATKDSVDLPGESNYPQTENCSKILQTDTPMQLDNKVSRSRDLVCSSETHLYQLVSVVEHFGRSGSGHYTVYRSVRPSVQKQQSDDDNNSNSGQLRWFSISDSQVSIVSEIDVLAAEASLLFYEKVG